ncbi:MAG: exosortase K [Thermoanaerobaculia bacterium]
MKQRLPWVSWGAALLAAYGLKLSYSRASAGDLAWILVPTARAVGWLRGETLIWSPGAGCSGCSGWIPPDGSYRIAPVCAGVNFLILVLVVSVLGFAHRLSSPGQRLAWWLASLLGAYAVTIAVNTLRILAAVELYRIGPVTWLTREQEHRLLGTVLYLGALWGLFCLLDRLTSQGARSRLAAAVLVPGAYLGMTVAVPLLNGASGERFVEHAMMVSLTVLILVAVLWRTRDGQTDDPGRRG